MSFVKLKRISRSWGSNLGFAMPWWFCLPNLVRRSRISLQILSRNHLSYVCVRALYDLSKMGSKSPGSNLASVLPWGFCVPNLVRICQIFLQLLCMKPFQINLNDFRDLKNEIKVMRFELGLCLAMGPLCTELRESLSSSSSDIGRKPF